MTLVKQNFKRLDACLWELPMTARAGMQVPVRVYADDELL